MTEILLKILAAIAPAIVLAIVMVRRDKRPEPIGWLFAAVGLGILVALAVILLGYILLPDIPTDTFLGAFFSSFVDAAIPEELLKFAALCILAKYCRHFDEYIDGIVYAVCIGMGFAAFENILYLISEEEWMFIGISRALLSVPAHYFFAIIMGLFFALAHFDKRNQKLYLTMAVVIPIIVHGLYDSLLFAMPLNEDLSTIILLLFLVGFRWIRRYAKTLMESALKLDTYADKEN